MHDNALPVAAVYTPTVPSGAMWNCGKCKNVNNADAIKCNNCSSPQQEQAYMPENVGKQQQKIANGVVRGQPQTQMDMDRTPGRNVYGDDITVRGNSNLGRANVF